jgi:glycyl-tRNA synthetase
MSDALYGLGGLRFWNESEIELREAFQSIASYEVGRTLRRINPAFTIARCEGPILTPRDRINPEYSETDIFVTSEKRGGQYLCLRAETTASSYAVARHMMQNGAKLPICVWQAGKSFRTERNDGASAAKLRFNEFWQQEFQVIYRADTKADYRTALMERIRLQVKRFTGLQCDFKPSDRLPSYSESTVDIEVMWHGKWKEVASCSIRNDFGPDIKVCEIAIGLCRIATMAAA